MSFIDRLTITYSRTLPTKPYGNDRLEVTAEIFLDGDDVPDAVLAATIEQLRRHVDANEQRVTAEPLEARLAAVQFSTLRRATDAKLWETTSGATFTPGATVAPPDTGDDPQ